MTKLMNALGFQAGWWACVGGVRHNLEAEAIIFCLILIGIHLRVSKFPLQDIKLGIFALLIGVLVDSSLQHFSIIRFYGWALGPLSPFWDWTLWVMFALTLNASLDFLKNQSHITTPILGLVFGPLTYFAGAQLGAAALNDSPVKIFSLAAVWMIALPLLVMAAEQVSHTSKDNTC